MRERVCSVAAISKARRLPVLRAILVAGAVSVMPLTANAAEFGSSPYPKGFLDIFAGILPPEPGLYGLNDVYFYEGSVDATIFNGAVQAGVDARFVADFLTLTYVTKWKILGGTYAFGLAPSVMKMDTSVGLTIPEFTGPLGRSFGPFDRTFGDTEFALGDTGFIPITLGWHSGNFYWNTGVTIFAPTGDYSTRQLASTSLNHWAVIPTFAITYWDQKSGWQASSAFAYAVNFENPDTDYTSGNLFHNDSCVTKIFGPLQVGAVAYTMVQTTPDSGRGARLGANESQVYGVGPIVSYTLGAKSHSPVTITAKWYREFGAENTFEGDTVVGSASFKF